MWVLCVCCDPNYSWDVPTQFNTQVGTSPNYSWDDCQVGKEHAHGLEQGATKGHVIFALVALGVCYQANGLTDVIKVEQG